MGVDESSTRKNQTKQDNKISPPHTCAQKLPARISITARLPLDAAQCRGVDPFPARTENSAPYTPTSSFTTCSTSTASGQWNYRLDLFVSCGYIHSFVGDARVTRWGGLRYGPRLGHFCNGGICVGNDRVALHALSNRPPVQRTGITSTALRVCLDVYVTFGCVSHNLGRKSTWKTRDEHG